MNRITIELTPNPYTRRFRNNNFPLMQATRHNDTTSSSSKGLMTQYPDVKTGRALSTGRSVTGVISRRTSRWAGRSSALRNNKNFHFI
ncbi:hypothetical protein EVAR_10569_1 [Eumeta japonica]|uniref:Uncharacterized protein n=1 Tax=Eumeta variegata TaxID=151549 RepID=A0A4C1U233_EUMVA|nr:hypothetical protein EVAR_10569_1 [Eumeta japonica]